ncbi:MAG: F0F1 ATP synthase subunit beta, partial [Clostridia bacterium]|nr:F0F1 ATP synthase subunit beta [Clostridia bacterium]
QRFLSQPMFVAEKFTGLEGKYVSLSDTISGFAAIIDGKCDDMPEEALYNVGTLEEAQRKAERLLKGDTQ